MTKIHELMFAALFLIAASGCGGDDRRMAVDAGTVDGGADVDLGTGDVDLGAPPEVDAGPGDVDSGTPPTGACTNAADTAIHASMNVSDAVGTCAGNCFGGAPCTATCVVTATGLSMPCADCYGAVTGCTSMNCALQCIGGDTPGCMSCRATAGCDAAFAACAGL